MNLQTFQTRIQQAFPYVSKKHTKFLLAVSGGLDSVVLLDLFAKAEFAFAIAHCNFHLRGEESNRDEAFVTSLAEKYQKQLFTRHFDTQKIAQVQKTSIEETARNLRYNWFSALLKDENIFPATLQNKFIVTAHHANDSIETLLFNFFRGTGISGLHGIPERIGNIIRPLLFAKREDIKLYAEENSLTWIEDSSNQSEKYTRNFFRLNFLPKIQEYFPKVENNLLDNIQRFKEAEMLYSQAVEANKKKLLQQKGNEFFIPVLLLQKLPAQQTLLWEILKDFSFSQAQIPEVMKLLNADSGSHIDSSTHKTFKNRAHLVITTLQTISSQQILIEEGDKKIVFANGIITKSFVEGKIEIDKNPDIALLDAKEITFPLLLRKWKQGDYFYPLGMKKKKKLSRFFIDQKLSLSQKENVWIIESNKRIVWIVGMRIDERFKVLDATKKAVKLVVSYQ
ncbi:tRNA lysidine(34) synthetase TilS [Arachidicoccus ginsenosidimutans]|uniref:tRNA lysidine(34) synthetase TilS n=1 Tax=Arachidicoccus sp. BS20 TaxID=1850526 RepID=UPI0007F13E48|nr:tRNA lysidine(34) synthetase TilS [Arachidicoccus sp. BS20]ANI88087.1 tRNA lysidine(34) synthetase TilS [Arachidicoccus sp. BS20]